MAKKELEKSDYVMVRIPRGLYDEVEQLRHTFMNDPVARVTGRVSTALALRLLLLRGIATVRRELKDKAKGDVAA